MRRRKTRPQGAPLTVIFARRKNRLAPLDGSPALIGYRGAEDSRNGEQPPPTGSGDSRPASAAAPVSAPAREGAALADAPGATDPRPFPAEALVLVVMHSPRPTLSLFAIASSALDPCAGWGPALACRRRALEAVEKVVTAQGQDVCQAPLDVRHRGLT